ncbi:hypothetical protein JM84_2896 [Dokdonia sp. Hel_I_63]|nr:hypothetical protein Krodi_1861 [Dokdonia sp. 4H-3-7-5]TVZ23938.1 hypothetical protein JM84_2896 [Dokdonia sp. Hel_I_63]
MGIFYFKIYAFAKTLSLQKNIDFTKSSSKSYFYVTNKTIIT